MIWRTMLLLAIAVKYVTRMCCHDALLGFFYAAEGLLSIDRARGTPALMHSCIQLSRSIEALHNPSLSNLDLPFPRASLANVFPPRGVVASRFKDTSPHVGEPPLSFVVFRLHEAICGYHGTP